MICGKCGTNNESDARFCRSCGEEINQEIKPEEIYSDSPSQTTVHRYEKEYTQEDEHVSVGGWIGRLCINLIPIVGPIIYFIMLFIWAFGSTPKKSLKTYARASLIFMLISLCFVTVLAIIMISTGFLNLTELTDKILEYYNLY